MTQETLFRLVEAFDAGTMTRLEYCEGEAKLVLERTVCAPAPIPAAMPAVPMAARVSQIVGQEANPGNFLLMHAMGPNVAGVVGSAVVAGVLLSFLG